MSRAMATRRRGLRTHSLDDESSMGESIVDESEQRAERLDADNARLRDELTEAEGWYRLLQADHGSLQARHGQVGRKAGELQAKVDRLVLKNQELEALVDSTETVGASGSIFRGNDDYESLQ